MKLLADRQSRGHSFSVSLEAGERLTIQIDAQSRDFRERNLSIYHLQFIRNQFPA